MTSLVTSRGAPTSAPRSTILHGDCVTLMDTLPANSVDFILTDPPYLVNYRPRSGQSIANDNGNDWLQPAANGMYRVLKPDALCVSFYGWPHADLFMAAWRKAGFRPVGHITFVKRYASSRGYLRGQHEMAYLLAKGRPPKPKRPISDVIEFAYTGNVHAPDAKAHRCLAPLDRVLHASRRFGVRPVSGFRLHADCRRPAWPRMAWHRMRCCPLPHCLQQPARIIALISRGKACGLMRP